MNDELKSLYENLYSQLSCEIIRCNKNLCQSQSEQEQATNPLLLMVNGDYINSDLKVMFFGQETNGWYGEENNGIFLGSIEPLLNLYEIFYLKNGCFSYGGQFWNGIKRFQQILNASMTKKKIGYLWNNVVKIGKLGKGHPATSIIDITHRYFDVIQHEIEITKPDIVIFFSGPNYDNELKNVLGNYAKKALNPFSERQLSLLKFHSFNFLSYRTYHPNFLWRNNIDGYLSEIVNDIKINFS